jgi:hypothetical protein
VEALQQEFINKNMIKLLQKKLYSSLTPFFEQHGFELLTEKQQFRKMTPTGFQNVIFTTTQDGNDAWLEVHVGVRHQEVEHIAQQFLSNEPAYWQDANTLVVSIGQYNKTKYFGYRISNDEDIQLTTIAIEQFMTIQGLSFMEHYSSIVSLHHIFNKLPYSPCPYLYNQVHRCFKGIVVAKLINEEDFITALNCYLVQMPKLNATKREIKLFDRMSDFLLHYCFN